MANFILTFEFLWEIKTHLKHNIFYWNYSCQMNLAKFVLRMKFKFKWSHCLDIPMYIYTQPFNVTFACISDYSLYCDKNFHHHVTIPNFIYAPGDVHDVYHLSVRQTCATSAHLLSSSHMYKYCVGR